MKDLATKANNARKMLDELPNAFARMVVADFIIHLAAEHKKDLLNLLKQTLDAPVKSARVKPLIKENEL